MTSQHNVLPSAKFPSKLDQPPFQIEGSDQYLRSQEAAASPVVLISLTLGLLTYLVAKEKDGKAADQANPSVNNSSQSSLSKSLQLQTEDRQHKMSCLFQVALL